MFKKQRIDNLNMEYNTKEMEYQRVWSENQDLKSEIRGETSDCYQLQRETDMIQRDIIDVKNEIAVN